jgi:hypothetical protein
VDFFFIDAVSSEQGFAWSGSNPPQGNFRADFDFLFRFSLGSSAFVVRYGKKCQYLSRILSEISARASEKLSSLWIRRNGRSRIRLVKNVRQLRFVEIAWDGELTVVNRVVAHGRNRARDLRIVPGRARAGLVCGHFLNKDHAVCGSVARGNRGSRILHHG